MKKIATVCAVAILACLPARSAFAASCDSLAKLALKDTTITKAEVVAAGAFEVPGGQPGRGQNPYKALGEFCRVAATLTPTSDSDIKIEVWLPAPRAEGAPGNTAWNGKYQAVGNGGWAGVISYSAMAEALQGGYATASTDTGHVGGRGTFALGHPEKLVDFAWRSEHEMTAKAKRIIEAFYGSGPKLSYWNGCSTGGRQGLKAAQLFPEDYNGIIAGAPANRTAISLWIADAVLKDPARYIPPAKYPVIHQAALAACDAGDGLKDGLIDDPGSAGSIRPCCSARRATVPSCLTAPQVAAARQIHSNAVNPRTKKELFASLVPGTELAWGVQAAGPEPRPTSTISIATSCSRIRTGTGRRSTSTRMSQGRSAREPDHERHGSEHAAVLLRGGRIIMYHGWSDPTCRR